MLVKLTKAGMDRVKELIDSGFARVVEGEEPGEFSAEFEHEVTLEEMEYEPDGIVIADGDTVTLDSVTFTLPADTEPAEKSDTILGREVSYVVWDEVADIDWDRIKEVEMAKFSSKVTDLLKSNTSTIESAVIGDGRLDDMEAFVEVMEELLVPIMKHDRFWATTGPVKLSAYDDKKNKWKMVSCLGGEKLEYKGMRVGNRDGLLFQWFSSDISGVSDELVIETSIPKHGHMLAAYDDENNEVSTKVLRTVLAEEVGDYDLLEKIEEIRAEAEKIKKAEAAKKIEEQAEHYGAGFGSWG